MVLRAQNGDSEVAGSSPAFPAFEKWSKPRLKKELRKLDRKIAKLLPWNWRQSAKLFRGSVDATGIQQLATLVGPYAARWRTFQFEKTSELDERRRTVRMELKSRGKTKRLDAMKCT